jgi:hypothetical protein
MFKVLLPRLITGNGPQIEFHPPTEVRIPKYSPAAPTHNGIRLCAGPSLLCVLGEPYGTPSPDRDVAAVRARCTAPHPPTPRPYGLLPNMSESSGTPGENLARGSFSWPAHKKKPRQWGGAKVASDTGSGRAREITRPVALPTVGRRARLFPDFNRPSQRAGDSRQVECSSERLTRSRAPLRPRAFSGRL